MTASQKLAAVYVGCAGWSLPRGTRDQFSSEGTQLQRYASRLPAVEINSSFYRPHRAATYARWANSVPPSFRFSVKIPKAITHERRLINTEELLDDFFERATSLGQRLGCLLVQFPPRLEFDSKIAQRFLTALRDRYAGAVAAEPRHPSWFTSVADRLLHAFHVARVAADPPCCSTGDEPAGWPGLVYYRLHGSPRVYFSGYDAVHLDGLAIRLAAHAPSGVMPWCIFDNTGAGAATANALELLDIMRKESGSRRSALR